MPAPTFRVLSGGRTGAQFVPDGDVFVLGRHESAELRLHPEFDLSVSARHARVERRGDAWFITDLDSRNGTFVNGALVAGPVRLRHGDRIVLGGGGPELRFDARAGAAGPGTDRIRAAVRRERRRFLLAGALLVLLAVVAVSIAVRERTAAAHWANERALLEARVDSLIAAGQGTAASLQGEVQGLQGALGESERELRRLRSALAQPRDDADEEALRRDLLAASAALRRQQLAASLDFSLIQRRARGAVAMVWVEYTDGRRTTGTAFAVRPDGILFTNRHLLTGASGASRAARIAVRFSDSDQAFPARLVAAAANADLAALQVENLLGTVPVVPGFNLRADTLAAGAPLALIGFPLGGEPAQDPSASRQVARPVVSAALLLRRLADAIEAQGLGAAGASGSPILDARGEVVAVLFGGRPEGSGTVLLGVPAAQVAAFLASLPQ